MLQKDRACCWVVMTTSNVDITLAIHIFFFFKKG